MLNTNNIITLFCKLSNLSSSSKDQYVYLINNANYCVSQRLLKPLTQYTQDEVDRLEYAAACIAFYDYTAVELAKERTYIASTGKFVADIGDMPRLRAAALLKKGALDAISGLVEDDGFLFVNI